MSLGKAVFALTVVVIGYFILTSQTNVDVKHLEKAHQKTNVSHHSNDSGNGIPTQTPLPIVGALPNQSSASDRDHTPNAIDRIKSITEKNDFQRSLVAEHEKQKRYLPQNRILESEGQDPITQRYAVDERTTVNEDKTAGLTVWAEEKYYLQGETVRFYAKLYDAENQPLQDQLTAQFRLGNHLMVDIPMTSSENESGYIYQGSLSLGELNITEPGIYKIMIQSPAQKIEDGITFTLSKPDIELTNEFKDSINSDKELEIAVQVSTSSKNRYYIQGSLYGIDGAAIATSQASLDLDVGTHWVTLTYSGNLFKDANQAGPYQLKKMSLAKVTMPMQRTPLIETDFQTDSYSLAEFSQ